MARKKRRKKTKAQPVAAPGTPASAVQSGMQAHQAGRLADAAKLYREALEKEPDDADARHLLGVVALQSGNLSEAIDTFEKAIAVNDQVPAYHDHLGLALRMSGRAGEAEAHHRQALAIDPDFPAGHNNLAGTLLALGRTEEAETSVRRALTLRPGDTEAVLNLANIMLARGRPAAAVDAFEAAHRKRPATAETLVQKALAYHRAGRRGDGDAVIAKAAELAPKDARVLAHIGAIHLAAERFDAAADMFAATLDLDPSAPGAAANRGIALWRGGRLQEAEEIFAAHLEDTPDDLAALLGLAAVMSANGDTGMARGLYHRVLEADPDNLDALNNLATEGGGEISDANAERLAVLLGDNRLSDNDRAKAGFALAAYLRHCGEADTAFDIAATANEFRAAALARDGAVFNPEIHNAHVEARLQLFTPDFFAARRDLGCADEAPVFVVGMPRSGTTLVEQILASHPQVHGAGERRDLAEIGLSELPKRVEDGAVYPACLSRIDAETGAWAAGRYLDAVRGDAPRAARIVDKMPFNFMHLGLAALLFPNARIIHCRRDMRDVALSCFFTNFADAHPWSARLSDMVHYIQAYRRLMDHWLAVLPMEILEVDYEAVIADQEGESRRMIAHLGLEWDDACLRFHETERAVSTAARAQVRQPLYSNAVGRWRTYSKWIAPFSEALADPDEAP